jgi:hypothetical protein
VIFTLPILAHPIEIANAELGSPIAGGSAADLSQRDQAIDLILRQSGPPTRFTHPESIKA